MSEKTVIQIKFKVELWIQYLLNMYNETYPRQQNLFQITLRKTGGKLFLQNTGYSFKTEYNKLNMFLSFFLQCIIISRYKPPSTLTSKEKSSSDILPSIFCVSKK